MTIDKLIERLQWFKDQIGGDCEVKVADGDDEWGFALHKHAVEDEKSETGIGMVLVLDITDTPE
jgi:hypothetical protein